MEPNATGTQPKTSPLAITMLGGFRVGLGIEDLHPEKWELQKAAAVFKYLVCEQGRWVPDDLLLDHFWPEADPERGRKALRTTVYHLRRYLEPDLKPYGSSAFIAARRRAYRFRTDAPHHWDVQDFLALGDEAILAHDRGELGATRALVSRALALYGGSFLPEDRYEEWTSLWRERLRLRYLDLVARLSASARVVDPGAAEVVQHLIMATTGCPEREDLMRELMWHLAASGNTTTALKHYETCRRRLRDELGEGPSELTQALARRLREACVTWEDRGPQDARRSDAEGWALAGPGRATHERRGALQLDWASFRRVVEWERSRLRRSGRPASLLLILPEPPPMPPGGWEDLVRAAEGWPQSPDLGHGRSENPRRTSVTPWHRRIGQTLRSSDALCPLDGGRLILLLTETTVASARQVAERILAEGYLFGQGAARPAGSDHLDPPFWTVLPLNLEG